MSTKISNLTQADGKVLWCRSVGHAWVPVTDFNITTRADGSLLEYQQQVQCASCTAVRIQTIGDDFQVKRSTIRYPDGYVLEGSHALRRDARRLYIERGYRR